MSTFIDDSPTVFTGLVAIGVASYFTNMLKIVVLIIVIILFMFYFHRSPDSKSDWADNQIVAPSYGTVEAIKEIGNDTFIAIFLSPLDVHQQYYPINSIVKQRIYDDTGKFHLAYQLNKSDDNEKKIHILETAYGEVRVTQIAGFLPRVIVSDYEIGKEVKAGERLGIIRFGSRVDLQLPTEGLKLNIKVGDQLEGGVQEIGKYVH
jgi:phosphatidylserine decarboxylase